MLHRAMNKMRETLGMNGAVKTVMITTTRPAYRPQPIDGRSEVRSFSAILREFEERDSACRDMMDEMRESIRAYN